MESKIDHPVLSSIFTQEEAGRDNDQLPHKVLWNFSLKKAFTFKRIIFYMRLNFCNEYFANSNQLRYLKYVAITKTWLKINHNVVITYPYKF